MTRLSARQFKMLNEISRSDVHISIIKTWNQTTFGSILHREYISYNEHSKLFKITKMGSAALNEFKSIEIIRKIDNGLLSHYFNELFPTSKIVQMRKAS